MCGKPTPWLAAEVGESGGNKTPHSTEQHLIWPKSALCHVNTEKQFQKPSESAVHVSNETEPFVLRVRVVLNLEREA